MATNVLQKMFSDTHLNLLVGTTNISRIGEPLNFVFIDTGPFFIKLRILGDIHKICISGKIFAFHRSIKYILEHLLF